MTTTIRHGDDLPVYCALTHGFASRALHDGMSSYRLSVLCHVLGVAQMRSSAGRRDRPRDERLAIRAGWLARVYPDWERHVRGLAKVATGGGPLPWDTAEVVEAEPLLLRVKASDDGARITVPERLAYPTGFCKLPLGMPLGDRAVAIAWVELFGFLHHGGKKPLELTAPLSDEQIGKLNEGLRGLDQDRLAGHVTVPRRVARHGLEFGGPATLSIIL